MAKVTSKLQVTIPKALAKEQGIEPGDDIDWSSSGEALRLAPRRRRSFIDVSSRVELFDAATRRQREREKRTKLHRASRDEGRGWTREDLYDRAKSG